MAEKRRPRGTERAHTVKPRAHTRAKRGPSTSLTTLTTITTFTGNLCPLSRPSAASTPAPSEIKARPPSSICIFVHSPSPSCPNTDTGPPRRRPPLLGDLGPLARGSRRPCIALRRPCACPPGPPHGRHLAHPARLGPLQTPVKASFGPFVASCARWAARRPHPSERPPSRALRGPATFDYRRPTPRPGRRRSGSTTTDGS